MPRTPENQREHRNRLRNMAIEVLGGKCVNCGSTENLQFDHINNDRDGLTGLVSQLFSCSEERLLAELERCQLLCISCHTQKSIVDNGNNKSIHGLLSMYTNGRCRCEKCRLAHANYMRQYKAERRTI